MPGAEVRIEVGDDSAQMDGERAGGLLVAEAVSLECRGDRGELAFRRTKE
jgi:hypothetical protein